jgi:hypothetical protein
MPIWGVENTGNSYENGVINLICGLGSPAYENHPNVSTVQQSSLYLPRFSFVHATSQELVYQDNVPGSEFYAGCMQTAWNVFRVLDAGIEYVTFPRSRSPFSDVLRGFSCPRDISLEYRTSETLFQPLDPFLTGNADSEII